MQPIADRTGLVDLNHLGRSSVIGAAVLELDDGVAIVDPGPSSTAPVLRAGLAGSGIQVSDVRWLLVTHVHLDHAGACGSLVRENPAIRVVVHERGARHMADPSRLVASARRVFGERMDELWGPFLPVPGGNLHIVSDGDPISLGNQGRRLEVAYTPGHAKHHVSYFDAETRIAFVGDAAGARIRDAETILPATPPPDFDPDLIQASVERILEWQPERLFLTHFGLATDVNGHAARHAKKLSDWSQQVRQSLQETDSDQVLAGRFSEWVRADLRDSMDEESVLAYEQGAATDLSWSGLARYWRSQDSPGR